MATKVQNYFQITNAPRLRISVAQSYTCSTVSEEMELEAKKAVFLSCSSS